MHNKSISELIDCRKTLLPLSIDSCLWYSPDTEKLFKTNLKEQPEDWHYRTHEIRYDLNSLGYRTKEFDDIDWKNSMVIFGDSMIFGIGVSEEETISGQIEKLTGIPTVNLGVSGSSPTLTMHNSMLLIQSYPIPKYVVSMWSTPTRVLYYGRNQVNNLGVWKENELFVKEWNKDPYNISTYLKMNVKITRELWKNKCQYYEFTFFDDTEFFLKCDFIKQIDYARDIRLFPDGRISAHPGRKTYEITANKIINAFNLPRIS